MLMWPDLEAKNSTTEKEKRRKKQNRSDVTCNVQQNKYDL